MNHKTNRTTNLGCLTTLLIAVLVTTYLSTSSLNPLAVYSSNSIAAKIIVSLLAILLFSSLLQLLMIALMRVNIRITAGKPADDVICLGCGHPLIPFISSHGQPLMCPRCRTWWHNGPACYSKGLQQQVRIIPTVLCPQCRQATSKHYDLHDDLDDIVK